MQIKYKVLTAFDQMQEQDQQN